MAEARPTAIILLAAGTARRMEEPKQLLLIGGKPLLRHVVDAARSPLTQPFIVVLGAHADLVRPCLDGAEVHLVVHAGWAEGMGSSLRAGINALQELDPQARGVIVALADQPNFSHRSIQRLLAEQARSGRAMVATECHGTVMPPVYFASEYFPELAALTGDAGARAVLQRHRDQLATVRIEEMVDLDTPEDYARFRQGSRPASRPAAKARARPAESRAGPDTGPRGQGLGPRR
jgi:molybdenum cofactor cytidylyltransferase